MTAATVRCGSGMLLQHQIVFDLLVDTTLLDGTGLARVFRTSRTGLAWAARAAARRIKAPKDADDGTTPCRSALVDSAAFLDIADVITACGPVTAACGAHVVAADARGAVAWGRGRHGQRGVWSVVDSANVEAVRWGREFSTPPRVAQLSVGKDFTVFIIGGGVAYGCGNGYQGQLGTAPAPTRSCSTPRQIPELRTRVWRCAAGDDYSLWIVGDDRAVVGLGANDHGQLGTGDYTARTTSVQRCRVGLEDGECGGTELVGVTRIAAGVNHALAVAGGRLYAWGARKHGQLGRIYVPKQRAVPLLVRTEPIPGSSVNRAWTCSLDGYTVVDCAAGDGFSFAVDADGGLHATGTNRSGAMGVGCPPWYDSKLQRFQRVPIGDEDARWAVDINERFDLDEADALWSRGPRHERVVSVACGTAHAICRTADGRVYTWGGVYRTDHLALGHGPDDDDPISSARLVPYVSNAVHVAAGGTRDGAASSLVVRADGGVLAASNEPFVVHFRAARKGGAHGIFEQLRPAIPLQRGSSDQAPARERESGRTK